MELRILVVGAVVIAIAAAYFGGVFSGKVMTPTQQLGEAAREVNGSGGGNIENISSEALEDEFKGIQTSTFDSSEGPDIGEMLADMLTLQLAREIVLEQVLETFFKKLRKGLLGNVKLGKGLSMTGATLKLAKLSFAFAKARPALALAAPVVGVAKGTAASARSIVSGAKVLAKAVVAVKVSRGIFAAASMAVRLSVGAAMGPIGWAVQLVSMAGMLIDFWDPNRENSRLDFGAYNDRAEFFQLRSAFLTKLCGHAFPPIAQIQRVFPEEFYYAQQDVFQIFHSKAVEYILNNTEDDELTLYVVSLALNIPGKVIDKVLLEKNGEGASTAKNVSDLKAKMVRLVAKLMLSAPELRDAALHGALVRRVTEAGNRDFKNAKAAPFWYFALSIPTSFYTGALNTEDIPALKRGIKYKNFTIDDIKITKERQKWGRKYIDIIRAKSPYFEERVRAYLVDTDDVAEVIEQAFLPNMPDIADIAKNGKATYRRLEKQKFEDNMISKMIAEAKGKDTGDGYYDHEMEFGFRDQDDSDKFARAYDGAHSKWLSICCFQQFLLQLAEHPGVEMKNGELLRGVFKWREKIYRAFPPRPFHEPRFLGLDLRQSKATDGTKAVFLTEAFTHRWNEVNEGLWNAGSVVAEYRGIPGDQIPNFPVAVWTDKYLDVADDWGADDNPTPLKTRVVESTRGFSDVYHQDGRIVFLRPAKTRIVRVCRKEDFDKVLEEGENNDTRVRDRNVAEAFGLADETGLRVGVSVLDFSKLDAASSSQKNVAYYSFTQDEKEYVFSNRNSGQNTWVGKDLPVFSKASHVKKWPDLEKELRTSSPKKEFDSTVRNMDATRFRSTKNDFLGFVDVEIDVAESGLDEKVWVPAIGPPLDQRPVDTISAGEDRDLQVRIYHVRCRSAKERKSEKQDFFFLNHDGAISPRWNPSPVKKKLSSKRALFLPIHEVYCYSKYSMLDDDTMMRGVSTDEQLAKKCGFHENYVTLTSSGVPHVMLEKQEQINKCRDVRPPISFSDFFDETRIGATREEREKYIISGFKTLDRNQVVIVSSQREKAKKICSFFKAGEIYTVVGKPFMGEKGEMVELGGCQPNPLVVFFEFILGATMTKMIVRGVVK